MAAHVTANTRAAEEALLGCLDDSRHVVAAAKYKVLNAMGQRHGPVHGHRSQRAPLTTHRSPLT